MGRRKPFSRNWNLGTLCGYIIVDNGNRIHEDDLLHVLKRRGYRIKPKEFRAMLPVLGLKIDPEDGCTVQKRKNAYHGKPDNGQRELTQSELTAEVS